MVKISVIVPIYNVEKYLPACLESLISQTLKDIEIICINDASPDHCQEILDSFQKKSSLLKVITLKENGGTLNARIQGVLASKGQYLMFVDGDDSLKPEACEKLYELMQLHQVDILHFGMELHSGDNVSPEMKEWAEHFLTPYEGRIDSDMLNSACFVEDKFDFNMINKICRREVCLQAFSHAEPIRLVASEDRYTFFLLLYFARSYFGVRTKYYHYGLGIGITGGDILPLDKFEKRCSGILAAHLVDSFLNKMQEGERYTSVASAFAEKIVWDCVDCWFYKLEDKDSQEGFAILRKYFTTSQITGIISKAYAQKEMFTRAKLAVGKKIAIYHPHPNFPYARKELKRYIDWFQETGNIVILYTDQTKGKDLPPLNFPVKVAYLPKAARDDYGRRGDELSYRLHKDQIDIYISNSSTAYCRQFDTLLATLEGVSAINIKKPCRLDGEALRVNITYFAAKLFNKLKSFLKTQRGALHEKK